LSEGLGPLPPTSYVIGIEGDGYNADHLTRWPAWEEDSVRAYTLDEVTKAVADEREQCACTIDAMWNEYKASHPSYRTDYQDGYLDALDAAEQRIRGPNARVTGPQQAAQE
jgi:hypothetical protein